MTKPERIVAEVTRNWVMGEARTEKPLISESFEMIVRVNAERGYVLESWKMNSTAFSEVAKTGVQRPMLCETIVAVFRLEKTQ